MVNSVEMWNDCPAEEATWEDASMIPTNIPISHPAALRTWLKFRGEAFDRNLDPSVIRDHGPVIKYVYSKKNKKIKCSNFGSYQL